MMFIAIGIVLLPAMRTILFVFLFQICVEGGRGGAWKYILDKKESGGWGGFGNW